MRALAVADTRAMPQHSCAYSSLEPSADDGFERALVVTPCVDRLTMPNRSGTLEPRGAAPKPAHVLRTLSDRRKHGDTPSVICFTSVPTSTLTVQLGDATLSSTRPTDAAWLDRERCETCQM